MAPVEAPSRRTTARSSSRLQFCGPDLYSVGGSGRLHARRRPAERLLLRLRQRPPPAPCG
eukprot:3552082-Alexandrium_andersonii.AAC.1